jgi:hypothetical protein
MKLRAKQHPADVAAEWVSLTALAVAAGWSASRLGDSALVAACAAIAALVAGFAAMRLFGTASEEQVDVPFEPLPIEECIEESGELLLDDPLVEIESDSRVISLFAREQATPGEMIARIADFLGEERRVPAASSAGEGSASPPDASAALHAALANIRASLR